MKIKEKSLTSSKRWSLKKNVKPIFLVHIEIRKGEVKATKETNEANAASSFL